MNQKVIPNALFPLLSLTLVAGCTDGDRHKEVAEVAKQAADRQAEQNREMTRLNREVAEGTRRMVQADAETRREMIVVHQDIQAERTSLNDRFDKLEDERQQMASSIERSQFTFRPWRRSVWRCSPPQSLHFACCYSLGSAVWMQRTPS